MQDIKAYLEKLQVQTAECEMIRDLATDPKKRELFTRLAEHFRVLAVEVEKVLTEELPTTFLRFKEEPSPRKDE